MRFLPLPTILFPVLLLAALSEFGTVYGQNFPSSGFGGGNYGSAMPSYGYGQQNGVGYGMYPQQQSAMGYGGYPATSMNYGQSLMGGASQMVSPYSGYGMGGIGGIGGGGFGGGMYSPYGGSSLMGGSSLYSPYTSMGLGTSGFGGGLGGLGGNSQSALLSNYYGSIMSGMVGKR